MTTFPPGPPFPAPLGAPLPHDQPQDAPLQLYHIEEQEVLYWRTAVQARNADDACAAITGGTGDGEVIGKTVADRRISNVHLVTDACVERGCYDFDHEEREID